MTAERDAWVAQRQQGIDDGGMAALIAQLRTQNPAGGAGAAGTPQGAVPAAPSAQPAQAPAPAAPSAQPATPPAAVGAAPGAPPGAPPAPVGAPPGGSAMSPAPAMPGAVPPKPAPEQGMRWGQAPVPSPQPLGPMNGLTAPPGAPEEPSMERDQEMRREMAGPPPNPSEIMRSQIDGAMTRHGVPRGRRNPLSPRSRQGSVNDSLETKVGVPESPTAF